MAIIAARVLEVSWGSGEDIVCWFTFYIYNYTCGRYSKKNSNVQVREWRGLENMELNSFDYNSDLS